MQLASTRIITANFDRPIAFYDTVTRLAAARHTPDFAEIRTPGATLAGGSTRTLALVRGDEVAEAAANRDAIIEFRVGDVDEEYARLVSGVDMAVVPLPTTMPWGNRSLLSRDPDGALVNLFAPATAEAKQRLDQHRFCAGSTVLRPLQKIDDRRRTGKQPPTAFTGSTPSDPNPCWPFQLGDDLL